MQGEEAQDTETELERRVRIVTSVVAPTTVVAALLVYYGYVTTTAEFGYFGVSLGSLELSTQDLLLRSVGALYVPAGALLLVVMALLWGHQAVVRRQAAWTRRRTRRVASLLMGGGALVFLRGIAGVLVPTIARTEWIALSPICLGVGIGLLGYGRNLLLTTRPLSPASGRPARARSDVGTTAAVWGLVVLSLFWAANSFAAAYGRGQAEALVQRLDSRPAVVVDTADRLFVTYPGVVETAIHGGKAQTHRYRYRGFRLLAEANDRVFLVPDQWRRQDGATLVLGTDDQVRLQFYRTG